MAAVAGSSTGKVATKADYFTKETDAETGKRPRLLAKKGPGVTTLACRPDSFDPTLHFYERCLNSVVHPTVSYFFSLTHDQIARRYAHLNPAVDVDSVLRVLRYRPGLFHWAGSDMFAVANTTGKRRMCVVEVNSSPSGQKSMPGLADHDEHGGYRRLIETGFKAAEAGTAELVPGGRLAVVFDKNFLEASGYANTIADVYDEEVLLVEYHWDDEDAAVKFEDSVMYVRDAGADGEWVPVRAALRYVTQKPWCAFPITPLKTVIMNPIVACVAGGRNKLLASKSYDLFNAQLAKTGMTILSPVTIPDVALASVPLYVMSLGGVAVVKAPYGNAGQGVYTITSPAELDAFMTEAETHTYQQYIVQALIGGPSWSSSTPTGDKLFHVGTMPTKKGNSYVFDLRMMVGHEPGKGYVPIAMYARRARAPLPDVLTPELALDSWAILGTNLSTSLSTTDTSRLLLGDRKDMSKTGLSIDDLIDAFVTTVTASSAIDTLALRLCGAKTTTDASFSTKSAKSALADVRESSDTGVGFDVDLFLSMNRDLVLLEEITLGIEKADPAFAASIREKYLS